MTVGFYESAICGMNKGFACPEYVSSVNVMHDQQVLIHYNTSEYKTLILRQSP